MGEWKHLSYASSLCGNCTEVCAVKINLHELLLENGMKLLKKGIAFAEKMAWKMWKQAMLRRGLMNIASGSTKSWVINKIGKAWTQHRGELDFPKKSFNQLWKEKYGER